MSKEQILNSFLEQIVTLDTESTGIDAKTAEIVELATVLCKDSELVVNSEMYGTLELIPFAATAKNNISRAMLQGKPIFEQAFNTDIGVADNIYEPIITGEYLVAHNCSYDKTILSETFKRIGQAEIADIVENKKWICTYRLAQHLFEQSEEDRDFSYQLNYLRYAFDLDCEELSTHRAADDTIVCFKLIEYIAKYVLDNVLSENDLTADFNLAEFLHDLSKEPIIYTRFPFGKHKGEDLQKIPDSYYQWLLTKSDILDETKDGFNADLAISIEQELNRRLEK